METTEAFLETIKQGDLEQAEVLLNAHPELARTRTANGVSAILLATYYNQTAIADLLLARGASTTIFEAAALGQQEQAVALLDSDPTLINAVAPDGFSPLGLAAFFGHTPVVQVLLERGADVNQASANSQRVMPLHSAVASQHLAIAEALLAKGADVNAAQEDGFTPLHEAAQNGQLPMVELLVHHGADIHATKADGKTALTIAEEYGHNAIASFLRDYRGTA